MNNHAEFHPRYTQSFSLLVVFFLYVAAYGAGVLSVVLLKPFYLSDLSELAIASGVATLTLFVCSRLFRNSSVFDAYWSIAPLIYINFWMKRSHADADVFRQVLVSIALLLWGFRLTLNWVRGWNGLKHEDWRHTLMKKQGGWKGFMIDLWGLHLFQALMIYLVSLPLYPAMALPSRSLNILDIFALFICLLAVVIETLADEQLRQFKRRRNVSSSYFDRGIWAYSRHPNYFGEFLFWVGIFLFGISGGIDWWWTGAGVVAMFLMFQFISIPMMDKRMYSNRPEYRDYMKKVSGFFLFPSLKK